MGNKYKVYRKNTDVPYIKCVDPNSFLYGHRVAQFVDGKEYFCSFVTEEEKEKIRELARNNKFTKKRL